MGGPGNAFRAVLAIILGAALAYFYNSISPPDEEWILYGIGIIGALASYVVLYFMGKSG